MRAFPALLLLLTLAAASAAAFSADRQTRADANVYQNLPDAPVAESKEAPVSAVNSAPVSSSGGGACTLEAGTRVAVTLKHAISTRNARVNDPVYAETSFPVVSNDHIVIPAGSYVQGVIVRSKRAGRIKGRGELVIHFTALIFPSGYTLPLPGTIDRIPGAERTEVKEAGTIATSAGIGAVLGGLAARSGGGADIGGLVGAGLGVASILLTRGPDVRIENGTLVEMVLEQPITVEPDRVGRK